MLKRFECSKGNWRNDGSTNRPSGNFQFKIELIGWDRSQASQPWATTIFLLCPLCSSANYVPVGNHRICFALLDIAKAP